MSDPGVILVVEDNALNRKLVRDVLGDAGYEVLEATTAEDGIALAGEHQPDLVLMDVQLPGMDGMEAVRVLKRSEQTESIRVVAVTAFAMHEDREQAFAAGFDGYLTKPISLATLRAEVEGFLNPEEE